MIIFRATPEQFKDLSLDVHRVVFNEIRFPEENRFTYVLVAADEHTMFAYSTIIEIDQETVYMQHGGALPDTKGTIKSKRCYHEMIEWLKARYKRISTRIENKNVPMIKFALSEGLLIDGTINYGNAEVFLSLSWGFCAR